VPRRLAELAETTSVAPIGAVVARRGSTRYFFIMPAPAHRDRLETATKAHVGRWAPHVEYLRFVATVSNAFVRWIWSSRRFSLLYKPR
jgi:hypothetical protein